MIKHKSKESLNELKKIKVKTILILDYKKRNDCKISYLCTKIILNNSGTDEALKSMHQSIMTK